MNANTSIVAGTALMGPHGEVAEYLGESEHFRIPGVTIRRMAGQQVIPASHIGTEWLPVAGRVAVHEHPTGRWNTPVERWLEVVS